MSELAIPVARLVALLTSQMEPAQLRAAATLLRIEGGDNKTQQFFRTNAEGLDRLAAQMETE